MSEVCAFDELEPGTARRVEIDGVPVAVVRCGDRVLAVNDVCSHANVSLSGGSVWCDELEIECPKHGSTFSLISGEPATLPATQPIAVYPVEVVDGVVHVDVRREEVAR
jgi:3-phenylpropionate/trans-cinnamate dioxygenase ferredoxin subunit